MRRRVTCACIAAVLTLSPALRGEDLSHSSDERAQDETIARMRNLGTALMAWLTDNVAAKDQDRPVVRIDELELTTRRSLLMLLVPQYIREIPDEDGWGNDFEVYLSPDETAWTRGHVMLIRSPGRDGRFDSDTYEPGPFPNSEYHRDLVWSDGFFVRLPERHYAERPDPMTPVPATVICPGPPPPVAR